MIISAATTVLVAVRQEDFQFWENRKKQNLCSDVKTQSHIVKNMVKSD
jgi:hypothetical protein